MSAPAVPLEEFDQEMASTRKLLERVATEKGSVREARDAAASVVGPALDARWSLKHGERVLFTALRGEVVRGHPNHLIHHRGHLRFYLRLVDVPLPQIYGPTADERW